MLYNSVNHPGWRGEVFLEHLDPQIFEREIVDDRCGRNLQPATEDDGGTAGPSHPVVPEQFLDIYRNHRVDADPADGD